MPQLKTEIIKKLKNVRCKEQDEKLWLNKNGFGLFFSKVRRDGAEVKWQTVPGARRSSNKKRQVDKIRSTKNVFKLITSVRTATETSSTATPPTTVSTATVELRSAPRSERLHV